MSVGSLSDLFIQKSFTLKVIVIFVDITMYSNGDNGKVNATCFANQKKIPKGHQCPLCESAPNRNLKRHVIEQHLPYFWNVHTTCFQCKINCGGESRLQDHHLRLEDHMEYKVMPIDFWLTRVIVYLQELAHLKTGGQDLQSLLQYVVEENIYPVSPTTPFDTIELEFMKILHKVIAAPNLKFDSSFSPPTSPASLWHWRIISNLL